MLNLQIKSAKKKNTQIISLYNFETFFFSYQQIKYQKHWVVVSIAGKFWSATVLHQAETHFGVPETDNIMLIEKTEKYPNRMSDKDFQKPEFLYTG